jgi:hypothetical protein
MATTMMADHVNPNTNSHAPGPMVEAESARLELVPVGIIRSKFWVPDYQRGYRWKHNDQVQALLEDLKAFVGVAGDLRTGGAYCLQPVVVKRRRVDDRLELIDGQQRLTTLFLLYAHLKKYTHAPPPFSFEYETRPETARYLCNINAVESKRNIDFLHIYRADAFIAEWFARQSDPAQMAKDLDRYLASQVKVIWYEVTSGEEPQALFTRLNVGRILLTPAELIKALFLATHAHDAAEADTMRQKERGAQWDAIENDLHDPSFWGFLTNKPEAAYATRIELIFDMIVGKDPAETRELFTFIEYKALLTAENQAQEWMKVVQRWSQLREWHDDRATYHAVGYLVATGESLAKLIAKAETLTKQSFAAYLRQEIRQSLGLTPAQLGGLRYDSDKDKDKIHQVLLLFNIQTVLSSPNSSERYPFHIHKDRKNAWTLEHIHAQNAKNLDKAWQWQAWLDDHHAAVLRVVGPDLAVHKARILGRKERLQGKLTETTFREQAMDIEAFFRRSEPEDEDWVHGIANMALLQGAANTTLSNSVFEVKRGKVIELDRKGAFLPPCTRQVFLKYYTDADAQQVHFWSRTDRKAYLAAMVDPEKGLLREFLLPDAEKEQP